MKLGPGFDVLAASLSLSFQKTNRLEHKLCYEAMRFLTAKTYELKAGFPASLIQRGWKLTFSLLGGQIWTFLASRDLGSARMRRLQQGSTCPGAALVGATTSVS